MKRNEVFQKMSQFVENIVHNTGDKFKGGEDFFLVRHNAYTRNQCEDAELLFNAIGVDEKSFLDAYSRRFRSKLEMMSKDQACLFKHNHLGVAMWGNACVVTVLSKPDTGLQEQINCSSVDQIIRRSKLELHAHKTGRIRYPFQALKA